ncbi:MAG: ATP-binding protein [Deltaproteobacteria bacterium]|nr:ATP-binding protein [Deltaproteobacteria bacterium]
MLELSLHILDVVENSLMAGADLVLIGLTVDRTRDRLGLEIADNGSGIRPQDLDRVTDPFFTTRTCRRVGLGLPLLKQAAEQCDGFLEVRSRAGGGTEVTIELRLSHIDRPPLGDMGGTLMSLIVGRPEIDFVYRQRTGEKEFVLDTREIKAVLEGVPLSSPEVIDYLKENIRLGLAELGPI